MEDTKHAKDVLQNARIVIGDEHVNSLIQIAQIRNLRSDVRNAIDVIRNENGKTLTSDYDVTCNEGITVESELAVLELHRQRIIQSELTYTEHTNKQQLFATTKEKT